MAYNVNWKIEFKDIEERLYRIEILTNNYSGSPIPLRGAENPFETTEENDDDLFRPIRKQTGMLRIADTGKDLNGNDFNYSDLLPSQPLDHPVRLKYVPASGTEQIKWIGFLRSDTLTAKVFTAVDIREFQVVCPLGVLYDIPFTFTSATSFLTMGQILYRALSAIGGGLSWDYVVKSQNANNYSDLTTRVSLMNFVTVDPTYSSDNATWTDTKTWGEVLEDICRLWGWVMYSRCLFESSTNLNAVFLIAKGHTNSYKKFPFSWLQNASFNNPYNYDDQRLNLEDLSYKSTNHTEEFLLGKRYINILADVNEKEMVINPKMEELPYVWHYNTGGSEIHTENWEDSQGNMHYTNFVILKEDMNGANSRTVTQGEFIIFTNNVIRTSVYADFVVIMEDMWDASTDALSSNNKSSFNLKKNVLVWKGANPNQGTLNRCLSIKTAQEVCFPAGSTLCINANCRKWYKPSQQDADLTYNYLTLALKLGDEWWNGSSFVQNMTTFVVDLDNKNKKIKNTKNLLDNNNGASGYCIPISGSLYGRLELYVVNYIYDDPSQSQDIGVMLEDLAVSIYTPNDMIKPEAKAVQQYKDLASQEFKENLNVNLNMASGTGLKYGIGQLYDVNGAIFEYLVWTVAGYTQYLKPEENLLRRMKMAYGSSRHYMTIDVENSDANADPTTYFDYQTTGVGYSFLNAKRNWRDNKLTLTIVDFI